MDDSTIFLALCSLLLGGTLWYFYKKRLLVASTKFEKSQRKKIAHALLERAVDQRSTLRIENAMGDTSLEVVEGICIKITHAEMLVSVSNTVHSVDLIEKFVKIYFTVSLKSKINYFQCNTKVLSGKNSEGTLLLRMLMPKAIDTGQKRNFVRVTPHKDAVLALAVWPLSKKEPLPSQYAVLDPATFQYRPEKINEITLENISGGGMRLVITVEESRHSDIDLTLGSRLLVLVVLRSDDTGKAMPYWVAGQVRMATELKSPRNGLAVGLSYMYWAVMERGKTTPIAWFPADASGGISPLAAWTIRHHLEQHKVL